MHDRNAKHPGGYSVIFCIKLPCIHCKHIRFKPVILICKARANYLPFYLSLWLRPVALFTGAPAGLHLGLTVWMAPAYTSELCTEGTMKTTVVCIISYCIVNCRMGLFCLSVQQIVIQPLHVDEWSSYIYCHWLHDCHSNINTLRNSHRVFQPRYTNDYET